MNIERIIAELLVLIVKNQEKMMAQIDDLTAALATATTDTQKLITDVGTKIAALTAQLAAAQAANPGVDLTAAIASANAIDALVKAADVP
jgi:hypothetical protein